MIELLVVIAIIEFLTLCPFLAKASVEGNRRHSR
ncbi:MAG: hypothetical protein HS101_19990 [Planctomycetia bacterium]|nr:hypothetical protein [Planctomycetia bacterium]